MIASTAVDDRSVESLMTPPRQLELPMISGLGLHRDGFLNVLPAVRAASACRRFRADPPHVQCASITLTLSPPRESGCQRPSLTSTGMTGMGFPAGRRRSSTRSLLRTVRREGWKSASAKHGDGLRCRSSSACVSGVCRCVQFLWRVPATPQKFVQEVLASQMLDHPACSSSSLACPRAPHSSTERPDFAGR